MDQRQFAQTVYYTLIERIAEAQRKVVEIAALRREFEIALPPDRMYRSSTDSVFRSEERMALLEKTLRDDISENLLTVMQMEEIFEKMRNADMEASAAAMWARWKGNKTEDMKLSRSRAAESGIIGKAEE